MGPACFDELNHSTVMDRVRRRIADKRVLALIRSFLTAGVMFADGKVMDGVTGAPQGGIVPPLLANIALSMLDEHFCEKWDAHGTFWRREAPECAAGPPTEESATRTTS